MKEKFIQVGKVILLGTIGLLIAFELFVETKRHSDQSYTSGYNEATHCYKEWLLEVGYAEYDKRTGDWKLSDADTIQGDLITPSRRSSFVNIEDQIHALEDELVLLKKQQAINSKRKTDVKKSAVDFKKL